MIRSTKTNSLFHSKPTTLPCAGRPSWHQPTLALHAKDQSANQPKWLRIKSHYIRLLLLLSLWKLKAVPSTQLASLTPQLAFILLSPPPASANWSPSPAAVHVVFMCEHPTASVPQSHLAIFAVSIAHQFILQAATARIPLPQHSVAFKAVMVPLSDVTISSTGDSVSFWTRLSLRSSHLPYRYTILAMPDSGSQTKKCSFHFHICLFLPIYSVTYFSFEADLKCPLSYCYLRFPPPTTYQRQISSHLCP